MNEYEKRNVERKILDARAEERKNNSAYEKNARDGGYQVGIIHGAAGITFLYAVLLVAVLTVKAWLGYPW